MEPLKFDDSFIYKTGERIIPGSVSPAALSEHYTRYFFALDLCRGKKVLNVACGAGYGSEVLTQSATEIFNVDFSEQSVAYGNQHYGSYKNHFLTMDAQKMDFPANFFDVIVSFETFEHLPQYRKFLNECFRVLKKDGLLILSMPNKNITSPGLKKPLNPFHFKEWTITEFRKIIAGRFKTLSLYGQNFTQPNRYSGFLTSKPVGALISLIYAYTPAFIFRLIKVYGLKYKVFSLSEIRLLGKDRLFKAKNEDFELNNQGLGYAIMLFILKKTTR